MRAFLRSLPRPDFSETEVRSPWVVILNLVFVGLVLLVAEAVGRRSLEADKIGVSGAVGFGLA